MFVFIFIKVKFHVFQNRRIIKCLLYIIVINANNNYSLKRISFTMYPFKQRTSIFNWCISKSNFYLNLFNIQSSFTNRLFKDIVLSCYHIIYLLKT